MRVCYKWETLDLNWETININWEDLYFIIDDVIPYTAPISGAKKHDLEKLNKLPEEKKKRIIKIACKIKGEDHEYISYKEKKEDIIVTAEHIDIIIEELIKNKIIVNVQNIS